MRLAWADDKSAETNRGLRARMTTDTFKDIEKLETDLWEAADIRGGST